MLHEFDEETQEAIRKSLPEDLLTHVDAGTYEPTRGAGGRHWAPEPAAEPDAETEDLETRAEPAGAGARFPWWGRSRGRE